MNTFADFLSRDSRYSYLQEPTMDPTSFGLQASSAPIRQAKLWRRLLSTLLLQPTEMPTLTQLAQVLGQH
jgi:hypothetical protein